MGPQKKVPWVIVLWVSSSACCFIPFHLCLVHVNDCKALVATEDFNRVIATNIHVNGVARM